MHPNSDAWNCQRGCVYYTLCSCTLLFVAEICCRFWYKLQCQWFRSWLRTPLAPVTRTQSKVQVTTQDRPPQCLWETSQKRPLTCWCGSCWRWVFGSYSTSFICAVILNLRHITCIELVLSRNKILSSFTDSYVIEHIKYVNGSSNLLTWHMRTNEVCCWLMCSMFVHWPKIS